jgi:hypothetical protein
MGTQSLLLSLNHPKMELNFVGPVNSLLDRDGLLIGTLYLLQTLAILETSSVFFGYATAIGKVSIFIDDCSE